MVTCLQFGRAVLLAVIVTPFAETNNKTRLKINRSPSASDGPTFWTAKARIFASDRTKKQEFNSKQQINLKDPEVMAADPEAAKDDYLFTTRRQHMYTMDISPTSIAEIDAMAQAETDEEIAQILLQSYRQRAFKDGDVIIGVLLPIHRPASAKSYPVRCSIIWEEYGMHRMEQLIWTIEEINRKQEILPGVTIGYDIRDTCWTTQVALERTMDFIKSKAGDDHCAPQGASTQIRSPLAAVLGAASSEISVAVQEVAQMFDIPQVDFGSTSPQLSDKSMFRLFARVIPSDQDQATMLVDVIKHFGWQYVHGIYTEGNYGEKGYEAFKDVLATSGTCLASSRKFLLRVPDNHDQYNMLIQDLTKHPDTRVIVCFCDGLGVRALFRTLTKHNLNGSYVVVGSDGWNVRKDIIRGFESAANGGLSVTHWSPRVPDFEERFYSLTPHTVSHERNPWFAEYWAQKHGCLMSASSLLGLTASPFSRRTTRSFKLTTPATFKNEKVAMLYHNLNLSSSTPPNRGFRFCTGNETTPPHERLKQEAKLGFVVNSVYAVAHAIRNILLRECWGKTIRSCEHLYPFVNGSMLFESLRTVSFLNYANELVRFDTNMDGVGKYQLWNFQVVPGTSKPTLYRYMPIGEWENNDLFINDSLIVWPANVSAKVPETGIPESFCSKACNFDQIKVIPNVALPCCWDCIPCPAGAYVSNGTRCVSCKPGWAPNELLTDCEKVKIRFRNLSEIESVVVVTVASVGMVSALVVWFAYSFTKRLSVPRAFSLVGILVTFTTVFSLLARPTLLTCYFSRILPPIAQSILFSPIFNRANAMVRIVNSSRKLVIDRRPRFISTNSQIALTCFIIGAQCTVVVLMLIWEAADVKIVYPSYNTALLVCRSTFPVVAIPLAFNGVILFATMVYAMRTRKIKQMIRSDESIYYPMVMGANCMITFSEILFFYAVGTQDYLMTAAHQLIAGFSTIVMFVLPLFSGPEQVDFDERTFAESVRHDINQRHTSTMNRTAQYEIEDMNSKKPVRRKSVSMRLWDTMTVMREVAASTKTGQLGHLDSVDDDATMLMRVSAVRPSAVAMYKTASASEFDNKSKASSGDDVFGGTEGEQKRSGSLTKKSGHVAKKRVSFGRIPKRKKKRRFFKFSSHDAASGSSSNASKRDEKEREKQERYMRARNAFVLVTAPSDSSTASPSKEVSRTVTPERPSSSANRNQKDEGLPEDPELENSNHDGINEEVEEEEELQFDDDENTTEPHRDVITPPTTSDEKKRGSSDLLEVPIKDGLRRGSSSEKSTSSTSGRKNPPPPPSTSSKESTKTYTKVSTKSAGTGLDLNVRMEKIPSKYGSIDNSAEPEVLKSFKTSSIKNQPDLPPRPPSIPQPPLPPLPARKTFQSPSKHSKIYSTGDDEEESLNGQYAQIKPASRYSESASSTNLPLSRFAAQTEYVADFSSHRSFDDALSSSSALSKDQSALLAESSSADSILHYGPTSEWRFPQAPRSSRAKHNPRHFDEVAPTNVRYDKPQHFQMYSKPSRRTLKHDEDEEIVRSDHRNRSQTNRQEQGRLLETKDLSSGRHQKATKL